MISCGNERRKAQMGRHILMNLKNIRYEVVAWKYSVQFTDLRESFANTAIDLWTPQRRVIFLTNELTFKI
jgi:hypothetical protein